VPPEYRRAIADGSHQAKIDALEIPADDRFVLVLEHAPEYMIRTITPPPDATR
jgi:hypothetical protein